MKYFTIALRLRNVGERGILARMVLLRRMQAQPLIMFIGLCGAARVHDDIGQQSAMSAVEGLNIVALTGSLYADLGHFGRVPIRRAWSCLVFQP